jgi:hypothetical protein
MVLRITLVISAVFLTACANNTILYNPPAQIMSHEDLDYYGIDCAHAAEQRKFLNHMLANISPADVYNQDRSIIRMKLNQIRDNCDSRPRNVTTSCVNVREDMKSGSAIATQCVLDPRALHAPMPQVTNHWDPLVDTK